MAVSLAMFARTTGMTFCASTLSVWKLRALAGRAVDQRQNGCLVVSAVRLKIGFREMPAMGLPPWLNKGHHDSVVGHAIAQSVTIITLTKGNCDAKTGN
jgi:hypothetical protein